MKSLNETRAELWNAGLNYGKACIEAGLPKKAAIEKCLTSMDINIDKDTEIIIKCAIAFAYC